MGKRIRIIVICCLLAAFALPAMASKPPISRVQAEADLDQLKELLINHFSYLDYNRTQYLDQIDSLKSQLPETVSYKYLGLAVQKILCQFGDAHTRVIGTYSMMQRGYLPARLALHNERVVCLSRTEQQLLHPDFPYLESINGVSLQQLMAAAGAYESTATEHHRKYNSLIILSFIRHLLNELGKADGDNLEILLANEDGSKTKKIKTKMGLSLPRSLEYNYANGILSQNIAYLSVPVMSNSPMVRDSIFARMGRIKDSDGLLIDLRNNGGGGREVLMTLFPYFLSPEEKDVVVNVAAFRKDGGDLHMEGYLKDRHLHPVTSEVFSSEQADALRSFGFNFKPEWSFPDPKFSNLHYTVLNFPKDDPRYYHYNKPVAILMNTACLGEAEVFIGAMKGREGITLMGTSTSGGGSGNPLTYKLRNSKVRIKISTMTSYAPDGQLFLGHGIEPDVEAAESLSDIVGSTDSQLNAAIRYLIKQN